MAPGGGHLDRKTMKKTLRGIVGNPIILGILAGVVWSLLGIPLPAMAERTVSKLAATATPLGLIALGASIDLKKAAALWKPTAVCSAFKLVVFVALFLPAADPFWVPGGVAGGDPGDAGLSHDRQLLYYGAQHGT